MRVSFLIIFISILLSYGFSTDIGGALSIDYYNNPITDSAPSPIQQRPILFYNININLLNLRSGFGITEAYYEVHSDGHPVFNDYYSGFYTLEFDIFTYPGLILSLTDRISIGLAAGGGVRLSLLVKEDDDISSDVDVDEAFNWFYSDMHFLYWGAQLFLVIKLPLSRDTRFFGNVHYRDFIYRDDEWIVGATAGLLWRID